MKKYKKPQTEIVSIIEEQNTMCVMTLYIGSPYVMLESVTYDGMGYTHSYGEW